MFSPHPDDECIVGGLALRLLREAGWNVLNVAVTLGSKKRRRSARLRELGRACRYLGFELLVADKGGLEKIVPATRTRNPKQWARAVESMADILRRNPPRVVFLPHKDDRHETHVGVHYLLMDALGKMPAGFECHVVETEFWGQMAEPNLLVEIGGDDLADLMAALSMHAGEVKRNAYHLRLPAWMMDNVRRAELVGRRGSRAPQFDFATIYRVRKWRRKRLVNAFTGGKYLSARRNPALLFA
jgi:LmbE family N-acetylglucosaminyl deacetylase